MKLPVEFTEKMRALLGGDEYQCFLESYDKPRYYGLRVNTLKISVEEFLKISPFKLEPIPWTRDGFYYAEGEAPGRHPYYYAGLYYIQEPSAMLPGNVIDAKPGEAVLDLCAAPGGKTVQIAAGMKGQGIIVANDISSDRVKALVKNIELCGVRNAVVTNESPDKLAQNFQGYFDKILIDAPCSGEGMFRKDEDAARSWQNFKCEKCAGMQWDILENIDGMLKPGGVIVYSTCTFSPEENEIMISRFLDKYKDYEIMDVPKLAGMENGRPEWAGGNTKLAKTARLWPHRLKCEGHFVAKIRKKENTAEGMKIQAATQERLFKEEETILEAYEKFQHESLNISLEGYFQTKGGNLYHLPCTFPDLSRLRVAKFGWYLGQYEKGRFDPSHSMVISLRQEDIRNIVNFASESREVLSYLKGETLMIEGSKGLTGICVDGYTIGWAKQTGDMLKNLYPKGWRKMS